MGNGLPTIPILFRIELPKKSFFDNESITGQIMLNLEQPLSLSDVCARLKVEEKWKYSSKDSSSSKKNKQIISETFLNIGNQLGISLDIKQLLPGQYIFPFSFPTINQLQPTFEYEDNSYLRYIIEA